MERWADELLVDFVARDAAVLFHQRFGGGVVAVVRLFGGAPVARPLVDLVAILPLISIVWGNLTAMRQTSFRRMIAYSSIAHAGYLFYAFLGDGPGRFQAVVFYVLAYGLMNLLAFCGAALRR